MENFQVSNDEKTSCVLTMVMVQAFSNVITLTVTVLVRYHGDEGDGGAFL